MGNPAKNANFEENYSDINFMLQKKEHPKEKTRLHPRNKHRARYDFKQLIDSYPELAKHVKLNKYEDESIDFSDPLAVKALNTSLLMHYYDIEYWDIPTGYLCPPIPGRADYLHHITDILQRNNFGKIPTGEKIKCLDIGVGANCIYPIIGNKEFAWSFVGSDIDPVSIESANKIITSNPNLKNQVECRLQETSENILGGIIQEDELFDLTICNPPFHSSLEESQSGNLRKLSNLNQKKTTVVEQNFGGTSNELWCEGGEAAFIQKMIEESKTYRKSCFLFSTLVYKQKTLKSIYPLLKHYNTTIVETIPMGQGNKSSRIVTWSFLSKLEQKNWKNTRWKA